MLALLFDAALLATSSKNKVIWPKADDPLLLAALGLSAAWLLLLAAFAYSTRSKSVEADAPTMDLGTEPPAIVNFLVNQARITTNGVQATLLDLAARKFIEIEEYGAGEQVLCRLIEPPPSLALESYSKIVYDHVRAEAVNGTVAAQALTTGTKGRANAWWRGFSKAVIQDAKARNLTRDRWSRPMWGIQRLVGAVAAAFILLVAYRANALEAAIFGLLLLVAYLHTMLAKFFGDQVLSEEGRVSAAHWLGVRRYLQENGGFGEDTPGAVHLWDRYLAYAASMGLATKAIRALPMGAEDDYRAWSAYGGQWRQVRVVYPRVRVVWGRSPLGALFTGIVIGAAGCGLAWLALQFRGATNGHSNDEIVQWIRLSTAIAIAAGVIVLAWGAHTCSVGLGGLRSKVFVEGEIIRRRSYKSDKTVVYFLALDDGKASRVRAWRVPSATYQQHLEGTIVRAQVCPMLGYVYQIDSIAAQSPSSLRPRTA